MTDTQVTWLTQEAHDRLKAELDQLIANRPVIAAEINDRREEGDLRENGGYHAAREEQGQQEARIRQLQELLNNAKVGEAPKQSGVALPGSVVKVQYGDDVNDTETFLIATRQEGVSDGKLEVYSPKSPLGEALIDAKVGDDAYLHGAQRQHRQGDAGPGRAVPRLRRTPRAHLPKCARFSIRSWRRSPKTCSCCCSTTRPRSRLWIANAASGCCLPRYSSISRTRAGSGRRSTVTRSNPAA